MLTPVCRRNLRLLVRAYAKATGRSQGQISKEIYGTHAFLPAFFSGKTSVSLQKYDRIIRKFAKSWPRGTEWPILQAVMFEGPRK